MVLLIGNVAVAINGILFPPGADAQIAKKFGRIRNALTTLVVALHGALIWIGIKVWKKLLVN